VEDGRKVDMDDRRRKKMKKKTDLHKEDKLAPPPVSIKLRQALYNRKPFDLSYQPVSEKAPDLYAAAPKVLPGVGNAVEFESKWDDVDANLDALFVSFPDDAMAVTLQNTHQNQQVANTSRKEAQVSVVEKPAKAKEDKVAPERKKPPKAPKPAKPLELAVKPKEVPIEEPAPQDKPHAKVIKRPEMGLVAAPVQPIAVSVEKEEHEDDEGSLSESDALSDDSSIRRVLVPTPCRPPVANEKPQEMTPQEMVKKEMERRRKMMDDDDDNTSNMDDDM